MALPPHINAARALGLQTIAIQFLPGVPTLQEHLDADPAHVVVAVQRHDRDEPRWSYALPKDRFLWIKAKQTVRIIKIKVSYEKQCQPQISAVVCFDDQPLDAACRVGELDYFRNRLIVLAAVKQDLDTTTQQHSSNHTDNLNIMESTLLRPPLQTIDNHNPAPLVPSNKSPKQTPRHSDDFANLTSGVANHTEMSHFNSDTQSYHSMHREIQPKPVLSAMVPEPDTAVQDTTAGPSEAGQRDSQEYQPREADDNPFMDHDEESFVLKRGQQLRKLTQDTTAERLEAGVILGIKALSTMTEIFEQLRGNSDAQRWLEQIKTVRSEATKTRAVVGVVGNTGAGKSSVINAMLDEERLIPTNCMRACTAVVTEISYNYSNADNARLRAEVVFIKAEDWRKELNILFRDLVDENGRLSSEIRNPDSLAGVAYAKMRAVYHKHTKEMLAKSDVESLMKVKSDVFYKTLQMYVDSKEKGTEKLSINGKPITNPKREFEHWPLIKVVKIYTKPDALSTGAVVVDLPGVHDSNAARAAVAEGYMVQCTGLWIVAPINRAVDDKAAKTLLGNTFKRQTKYDGTYSAVTFICSKTDDISRTEASESLKLGPEMTELEDRQAVLARERRELQKQKQAVAEQREDHNSAMDSIDTQLEQWLDLSADADSGKEVFAPTSPKKRATKRKRLSHAAISRKKARRSSADDSDDETTSDDSETDDHGDSSLTKMSLQPLTRNDIAQKVKELQALKKEARLKKTDLDEQYRSLRKKVKHAEAEEFGLEARQSEMCIAGRNEYSRTAIRQDFAAGIKELDQESAEEHDPANFDPEKNLRDYDEVERSLSVFCVSSRAYQQLCGRLQKDDEVPGFTTKEQTEIPQLQAHCKKLTESGRVAMCQRFLNGLDQLTASLGLWSSDDSNRATLTNDQRDVQVEFLDRKLKELQKALEKTVTNQLDDIAATLDESLFNKFRPAIAAAAHEALPTSAKWGGPRHEGGLHFMTYRATVRRNGYYSGGKTGLQDFNQQLFDPMQKQLASGWGKAFHRRLPHILQAFTNIATELLCKFHAAIEARCRDTGFGVSRLGLLNGHITTNQGIFNDLIASAITSINEGQREINREFTPVITACMEPAFEHCADDSGPGVYQRMKDHMADHVNSEKTDMFDRACQQVRDSLSSLVDQVRHQILDRVDSVYVNMRRDYLRVIGGMDVQQIQMSREERVARRAVDDAIDEMDRAFQKIVNCELEDLEKRDVLDEEDAMDGDEMDVDSGMAGEADYDDWMQRAVYGEADSDSEGVAESDDGEL